MTRRVHVLDDIERAAIVQAADLIQRDLDLGIFSGHVAEALVASLRSAAIPEADKCDDDAVTVEP